MEVKLRLATGKAARVSCSAVGAAVSVGIATGRAAIVKLGSSTVQALGGNSRSNTELKLLIG